MGDVRMFIVGSDDGAYRIEDEESTTKPLDSDRVMRLRQFEGIEGIFAATETGLYRSMDGVDWTDLGVPRETVYAVGADPSERRLYVGTRPAHCYVADIGGSSDDGTGDALEWTELAGFQDLPSRDSWRLPRHDDLAQVRDVRVDPGAPNRIVAGVEVGGVHVSEDDGETWRERSDGVHDDVHELHVAGAGEYVAATGGGCYVTTDAGRTWERLDETVEQSYFRRAFSIDGTIYASAALSNSSTWEDDDADPALFAARGSGLESIDLPRADEAITGMTAVDGDLVAATHRGNLFVRRSGGWERAGEFPVPGSLTGRYTPVVSIENPELA